MAANTPEGELKKKIVKRLLELGGVVEPLMTGLSRGRGRTYSTPVRSLGRADIIWLYMGRFIAVEVKAGTKQRAKQVEWQYKWESHGGLYWIVDSMENLEHRMSIYG